MKIDNHNFVVHCQLEKIFLVSNNIETEKEILSKYDKDNVKHKRVTLQDRMSEN